MGVTHPLVLGDPGRGVRGGGVHPTEAHVETEQDRTERRGGQHVVHVRTLAGGNLQDDSHAVDVEDVGFHV